MSERIGVYICECGPNIGDAIHIDQVISAIEPMANVATVKRHKLLCSGDGQNFLVDEIKNENLTHLVVAACSPKDHEITFMKVSVRGGINPYLSQVVNIREHCAWIFEDKEIATQKAIKYIKAGIERVRLHKPLLKKELDMNPDVVVVGGGIAGIESALSLAGPERKIYLIEKESELGGKVLKYRDIMKHSGFNLEMIDKKIEALNNNSQIEILTNTSVDRVIGFFGNYEITLKSGGEEGAERNLVAGAVVIATGFDFYDPTRMEKWGYTSVDNVVTSEEVVEMMGSDGKLTLKDGKTPKSVALVHCVGREEMGYCSKVCCTNLMEIAQYLKAKVSGIEIHELHRDICVPHEKDQKYYQQTVEQGVNFIRLQEVSKITSSGSQVNIAYKSISGKEEKLSVDMVILAPGIKPAISTPVVAEIINVPLHSTGFFKEAHEKLNPIATPMDGIFAVGCAQGPKNIVESVMQAQAATGKIFASLVPGRKLEPEVKVSEVIEAFCTGCQTCLTVCCYGAISYDENKGISVVNEAICRGCGNCAGSCPSNAIRAKHFTTSELYKEVIEALR